MYVKDFENFKNAFSRASEKVVKEKYSELYDYNKKYEGEYFLKSYKHKNESSFWSRLNLETKISIVIGIIGLLVSVLSLFK